MTRTIERTRKSGLCTGCGLCAGMSPSSSVTMEESADGWLRPAVAGVVEPKAQAAFAAACPGNNIVDPARESGIARHKIWGPIVDVRLGWASDPELRFLASSGGALSAVVAYLIETGAVEFALINAMSVASPLRNSVLHAEDLESVKRGAGSRYAPSAPLAGIDALLEAGRRFVFVGKPCDVAALRQLSRTDPRVDAVVPWMFAFFCAGVPSYGGTDALVTELGVPAGAELQSLRYRGEGWPGFAKAVTQSGEAYAMDYDTSWGRILNRHIQFRCKVCPDGIGEFADISFADGWHLDAGGNPSFDEAEGRSLVIARKAEATRLIEAAEQAGYLVSQPARLDQIEAMQPFQAERKGRTIVRLSAYALVGHQLPTFKGLALMWNALRFPVLGQFRNFFGTFRRLVRNRHEA